jgi:DNA mismatch repair ATPase MutS
MNAYLMYPDRDFDLQRPLPWNREALTQDLELDILLNAMALEDPYLLDVCRKALFQGLTENRQTIVYRQHVLQDCLKNPSVVREICDIADEAIERERKDYFGFFLKYPGTILHRSINVMQMLMGTLRELRAIADAHANRFDSEGFAAFFALLKKELTENYFAEIRNHLDALKFRDGVLISAALGKGNKGANYKLLKTKERRENWLKRLFRAGPPHYTFTIPDRDESGARALSELKDRGLNLVANALAQSADHIVSFFNRLRTELAFYMGCLNLHGQLARIDAPVCFPSPEEPDRRGHAFKGLYDACLALTMGKAAVGNDAEVDNRDLVVITGANQGGKSTFLRSIGLAQVMMQCGMFVPAESFRSSLCDGLFTHYRREEDETMKSGKLDEELGRMSNIVNHLTTRPLVLFNESFAATNEREGSEIARQIVFALLEKRIRVYYVTHLFEFARDAHERNIEKTLFLRAERQTDGGRTFRIVEGHPLHTSFGEDLYRVVFGADA